MTKSEALAKLDDMLEKYFDELRESVNNTNKDGRADYLKGFFDGILNAMNIVGDIN